MVLKTHLLQFDIITHQYQRRRSVLEVGLTFFYGMCGPLLTIRDHSKDWEAARGRLSYQPTTTLC